MYYKDVLIGCQAGFSNQEKVFMRGFSTPSLRDCSLLNIIGLTVTISVCMQTLRSVLPFHKRSIDYILSVG